MEGMPAAVQAAKRHGARPIHASLDQSRRTWEPVEVRVRGCRERPWRRPGSGSDWNKAKMKSSEPKAARAARAATAARAVTGAEASKASSSSDSCPAADTVSVGPKAGAVVIEVPGFPSRRKKAGKSLSVTCSFGGVPLSIPTHSIDRWGGTALPTTLLCNKHFTSSEPFALQATSRKSLGDTDRF